ncbi:MAG: hypothetical protein A2148_00820 [Chloroflexi bacterium RBG_16_68_14]|nr:MAG: hypothetical protein A2148_00820 [Chloroflexi bacterium RBG_16_68_14]
MVDEATVRAAVGSMAAADGAPLLAAEEVAYVVAEGDWVAVVLGKEGAPKELLARAHRHLSDAFPGVAVEVRAEGQVYRGGGGFGEGRHVVAVLGGKGGVGKSTLAVNLALTLSVMGVSTGLLDGDLNAPDIPHLLGVHPQEAPRGTGWELVRSKVTPPSQRRRPHERFGVEVMSVGFVVPERMPPMVTSRLLVSTLLRYLIFEVAWTADVLLIDSPPGTGEELQVMARELPLSGAIFVTTPQDLAQMDAERTLALLTEHDVPVIGLVQNMASMTCPHCDEEIDMFAQSPRLAEAGVPLLGKIPFDVRLSVTADRGLPLVLGDPQGPIAYEFAKIGSVVRRWLAERA